MLLLFKAVILRNVFRGVSAKIPLDNWLENEKFHNHSNKLPLFNELITNNRVLNAQAVI